VSFKAQRAGWTLELVVGVRFERLHRILDPCYPEILPTHVVENRLPFGN